MILPSYDVNIYGGIAQLVEHLPCKQGVIGSNPITSTKVLSGLSFCRAGPCEAYVGSRRLHDRNNSRLFVLLAKEKV